MSTKTELEAALGRLEKARKLYANVSPLSTSLFKATGWFCDRGELSVSVKAEFTRVAYAADDSYCGRIMSRAIEPFVQVIAQCVIAEVTKELADAEKAAEAAAASFTAKE